MSKPVVDEKEKKEKILYTCPCGFCSYDLKEFLKHPYMGDDVAVVAEQKEEALRNKGEVTK